MEHQTTHGVSCVIYFVMAPCDSWPKDTAQDMPGALLTHQHSDPRASTNGPQFPPCSSC